MGNTVYRYRLIDGWRIGENESWLSDMAARGLHLKRLGRMFARFERGEPQATRYRMDFTRVKPGTEAEHSALYSGSGWELICEQDDVVRVYGAPASSDAPEIHTDPAEQAATLKWLSNRLLLNGVLVTALTAASLCMMAVALFAGGTPLLNLVEGSMLNAPLLALLYAFMVFASLQAAFSVRALVRALREGRAIDHSANWRPHHRFSMAAMIVLGVIAPFVIVMPFMQIVLRNTDTLPPPGDTPTLLRLADIENDDALERNASYISGDVDWSNFVTRRWTPLAPALITIHEAGVIPGKLPSDKAGEYSPGIFMDIYELRFEWLSGPVMDELMSKYDDYDGQLPLEAVKRPGFDGLYAVSAQYSQDVYARKGRTVIHLRYFGEKDMDAVLAALDTKL